ncbi:MAG: hypothetical protein QOJ23_5543 [Actinomycetota bacterium]|nr:hypothetical protein [Actinomycetota bacterium]
MDDVNNVDEPMDKIEEALGSSLRRRDFLTKAAAAGAIAWAAPVILSRPAYAADGGGGTPNCRPTFTFTCDTVDCGQGGKTFAGFRVLSSTCPCSNPSQQPVTCIKITNLAGCNSNDITAYGNGTICSPPNQHPTVPDKILSTGNWECFNAANPVFFGHARSGNGNGSISNLGNGCTITFRLGVWVGSCPDRDSTNQAFVCQTFDVTLMLSSQNVVTCTFTPSSAANSLCTTTPPGTPPCTC